MDDNARRNFQKLAENQEAQKKERSKMIFMIHQDPNL